VAVASLIGLSVTSDVVAETVGIGLVVASAALLIIGENYFNVVQWVRCVWVQDYDLGMRVGIGWSVLVVLISVLFQIEFEGHRFVNVVAHGTGFMTGMIVTIGVFMWQRNTS
jgi:hypothetical protein